MKMTSGLTVSLIVCLALALATEAMGQKAPQTQNVNVVNTPNVNVVNTPNVTGTVSANQSGNWTVGLTPDATVNVTSSESVPLFVKPAPLTTQLIYKGIGVQPGCGFDASPVLDVSAYSQIRIYSRTTGSCNTGALRIYLIAIEKDTLTPWVLAGFESGSSSAVVDIPGERLQVVMEQSVTQCCSIDIAIYGR